MDLWWFDSKGVTFSHRRHRGALCLYHHCGTHHLWQWQGGAFQSNPRKKVALKNHRKPRRFWEILMETPRLAPENEGFFFPLKKRELFFLISGKFHLLQASIFRGFPCMFRLFELLDTHVFWIHGLCKQCIYVHILFGKIWGIFQQCHNFPHYQRWETVLWNQTMQMLLVILGGISTKECLVWVGTIMTSVWDISPKFVFMPHDSSGSFFNHDNLI